MEYKGRIQLFIAKPHIIYKITLYIITKVPTVIPILLANKTDITSIPSIAPPNLMVKPLPIPEISPPNKAHSNKSVPASGDAKLTSMGRTSVMSQALT